MNNTQDLSKLGRLELHELGNLIRAYAQNMVILEDNVKWMFDPSSGHVFLIDEDYSIAMMNGHNLERWLDCPTCGAEGFLSDGEFIPSEDGESCNNCD